MVLVYFVAKISDRDELVHDDGAVVVAPPEELYKWLARTHCTLYDI
jgi:hypothetical protein